MTTHLDAALSYAARGWRVHPLRPRDKRPLLLGWPEAASTDEATIRAWWAAHPDANVGIATGGALVVLDVDPRAGGDDSLRWDLSERFGDLPRTIEVTTGGGGRHFYFRPPAGRDLHSRGGFLPGLDFCANGKQIVAPPSVHPSGRCYRWANGRAPTEVDLAELPAWLADLVERETKHERTTAPRPATAGSRLDDLRVADVAARLGYKRAVKGSLGPCPACKADLRSGKAGTDKRGPIDISDDGKLWVCFRGKCPSKMGTKNAGGGNAADFASWHLLGKPKPPPGDKREWAELFKACVGAGLIEDRPPDRPPAHTDEDAPSAPTGRHEGDETEPATDGDNPPPGRTRKRPVIFIHGQLDHVANLGRAAITAANDPPTLFSARSGLARVTGGGGTNLPLRIEPLNLAVVRGYLARTATWYKHGKGGEDAPPVDVDPPKAVAEDVFALGIDGLPVLEGVCPAPIIGRGGELLATRGYHPGERVWLESTLTPNVPDNPTAAQVDAAVRLLTDDLLLDFPFAAQADRANALALFLAPFTRNLFEGACPLHLVSAAERGSGKTCLVDLAHHIFAGRPVSGRALPTDDEEVRKAITSILLAGEPFVLLDNLREATLDSAPLAQTLTSTEYSDRLLGQSRTLHLRNRAIWTATANSPSLSAELARRCVRIRLSPNRECPWERDPSSWHHPAPERWALDNRLRLVTALLTMVRRWFAADCPPGVVGMASFGGYAEVVGGILEACRVDGFLANAREGFRDADADGERWRALVSVWVDKHGGREMTAAELAAVVEAEQLDFPIGDGGSRSQATRMGNALRKNRGRVFGARRLDLRRGRGNRTMACLGNVDDAEATAPMVLL